MRGINLGLYEQRVCVRAGRRNYPCVLWVETRGMVQDYTKNFDEPADYKDRKGSCNQVNKAFGPIRTLRKHPRLLVNSQVPWDDYKLSFYFSEKNGKRTLRFPVDIFGGRFDS
ncbi:MAG: hypothetical protein ACI84R_001199 [Candidatus Azotimanducaceae bacterium]|jgi:hypothetical protein